MNKSRLDMNTASDSTPTTAVTLRAAAFRVTVIGEGTLTGVLRINLKAG